jgi:hypothetical protein
VTPAFARVTVEARIRALEREHNDRAWAVFHTAAYHRAKRLGRAEFDALMSRRKTLRRDQSSAEFWDGLRAHVIANGGKVL